MKPLVLFAILTGCWLGSYAQKVTVDVYGGIITSTLRGDEDKLLSGNARFDRRYAFQGGLQISFPLSEILKLKTGVQYSQRGAVIEAASFYYPGAVGYTTKVKFDYVEVPFLLALGGESVHVLVGPQIAFLTKSDVRGLESVDYGIKYGMGFEFSRYVMAQILFYHGLSNMTGSDEVKMFNRYMGLIVGARLFSFRSKESGKPKKNKGFEVPHRTID